jgi:hypothetical protein
MQPVQIRQAFPQGVIQLGLESDEVIEIAVRSAAEIRSANYAMTTTWRIPV